MNWYKKAQNSNVSIEKWQQAMRTWFAELVDYSEDFTTEKAEAYLQELSVQTQQNMQGISQNIEQAISRIPDWNGSSIAIEARTPERDNEIGPQIDASVTVGQETGWGGPADFTYFMYEGEVMAEDVLSAGDTDFFTEPATESDYFSLIQELRSPGKSAQPGKILTLYTARPTADRATYEGASVVPHGIYLTNDPDRAVGIGVDLGGSAGMRDIWQVRIDERYLMITNDAMRIKDYQVVGNEAPVQSIQLIQEGAV